MTAPDAGMDQPVTPWNGAATGWRVAEGPAPSAQQVFAGLILLAFANGIADRVVAAIRDDGPVTAVFDIFGVSVILWLAVAVSVRLLLTGRQRPLAKGDVVVAATGVVLIVLPVSPMACAALFMIGLWLWLTHEDRETRAAGMLAMILTIPLLWVRVLFAVAGNVLLGFDAWLVATAVGVRSSGNLIPYADGSGAVYLIPGCSSFFNMALALLSAAIFVGHRGASWSAANIAWTGLTMLAVAVINLARIGLISLYPDHYGLLHGPVGAGAAAWLTLAVILLVGYHRIGRDARRPH